MHSQDIDVDILSTIFQTYVHIRVLLHSFYDKPQRIEVFILLFERSGN
jgi:hypothetical protein